MIAVSRAAIHVGACLFFSALSGASTSDSTCELVRKRGSVFSRFGSKTSCRTFFKTFPRI